MPLKPPKRSPARRVKRFVIYKILHVDDTPHRIALGIAIGIFMAWMPLPGLQMILVIPVAALLGANKAVGVPLVWLNNPLTAPVNLLSYWLGCWMLQVKGNGAKLIQTMSRAIIPGPGFVERFMDFFHAAEHAFLAWLVGSVVLGLVTGTIAYLLSYRAVAGIRRRRARRRAPSTTGTAATPMRQAL